MSYTFLREQGEESSVESFSDIPAAALSSWTATAAASSCNGSGTDCCPGSPSGMTCAPSTEPPGGGASISFAAASLARTSAPADRGHGGIPEAMCENGTAPVSRENAPDCGDRWRELLARFDPATSSWKTPIGYLIEESCVSWTGFPLSGSMRSGELFRHPTSAPPMSANGCGYSPDPALWATTPTRTMPLEKPPRGRNAPMERERLATRGRKVSRSGVEGSANWSQNVLQIGLIPTAELCEFYMGWPIGWTGLPPLETVKFLWWLRTHGRSCTPDFLRGFLVNADANGDLPSDDELYIAMQKAMDHGFSLKLLITADAAASYVRHCLPPRYHSLSDDEINGLCFALSKKGKAPCPSGKKKRGRPRQETADAALDKFVRSHPPAGNYSDEYRRIHGSPEFRDEISRRKRILDYHCQLCWRSRPSQDLEGH